MARTLSVPPFDFLGGLYYPAVVELLISQLRENVPEITNESRGETAIELISCFALAAHLSNCLIDVTAYESLMVTCQLRDSLVNHLKLIDFRVDGDIPATVDLLLTLSKTFTATELVVPELSACQTKRRTDEEPIAYEVADAYSVTRTDQVSGCFVFDASGPTYTDRTTSANTDSATFAILPATPAAGDALYLGHDSAMTDRVKVGGLVTPIANVSAIWEYSDTGALGDFPDSVTNLGSSLRLVVDGLLATAPGGINHAGLSVTVALNTTGAQETALVTWSGSSNRVDVGFLGQVSPSTDVRDYTVTTEWHRLDMDDDTNTGGGSFGANGNIDFVVPQDQARKWEAIEVDGVTAFWLRYRVITVDPAPVAPVVDRLYWNKRNNYVLVSATQGLTASDEVLGSSDGTASQSFGLDQSNVIDGTVVVSVDGSTWTEVIDFLSSTSVDEHYTVEIDSDGIGSVVFGDGVNGKIPPAGSSNVTATYRYGANLDGNVGANTITVNRSGLGNVGKVTNPRGAIGWVERRGATPEDRERLKLEGPASLRVQRRAVTGSDAEYLATQFKTADRRAPFVRAKAIEEGYGVKTIKLVTVGPAGAATDPDDRAELETYFNGDSDTGESGVVVANQRIFARDYTAVTINVDVTVTGTRVNTEEVKNAIRGLLSPVALADDRLSYRWAFGETVTVTSIIRAILGVPGVKDVEVNDPASNTTITNEQLPTYGTVLVNGA
jgi:uncharacterized phage protein gp47/JayE